MPPQPSVDTPETELVEVGGGGAGSSRAPKIISL